MSSTPWRGALGGGRQRGILNTLPPPPPHSGVRAPVQSSGAQAEVGRKGPNGVGERPPLWYEECAGFSGGGAVPSGPACVCGARPRRAVCALPARGGARGG